MPTTAAQRRLLQTGPRPAHFGVRDVEQLRSELSHMGAGAYSLSPSRQAWLLAKCSSAKTQLADVQRRNYLLAAADESAHRADQCRAAGAAAVKQLATTGDFARLSDASESEVEAGRHDRRARLLRDAAAQLPKRAGSSLLGKVRPGAAPVNARELLRDLERRSEDEACPWSTVVLMGQRRQVWDCGQFSGMGEPPELLGWDRGDALRTLTWMLVTPRGIGETGVDRHGVRVTSNLESALTKRRDRIAGDSERRRLLDDLLFDTED